MLSYQKPLSVRKTNKKMKLEEDTPFLPSMEDYFTAVPVIAKTEPPSDEETEEVTVSASKRRKLTAAERLENNRKEEEKLRQKEVELLTCGDEPQSAEQFDRVLLGNPNSSELWTKYIAYHINNTQIELARSVAKRALKTIAAEEIEEKFNIWLAALHLENNYGDAETFEVLFEEAARSNNSLKIHLNVIEMLADANKLQEMEDKMKKVKAKFKQHPEMWISLGKILYKLDKLVEARNLKDTALKTIQDKRTHLNLIVQFAIMEFNYGEHSVGEALFETILQIDPKRVDVWSTYVDQLVKKKSLDLARRVLDRAVGQKLPIKKMKTLFKKYMEFEEQFGSDEQMAHVRGLVQSVIAEKF